MNCPTCATKVPENATFCPKCGARLSGRTAEEGIPATATGLMGAQPAPASPGKVAAAAALRPTPRDGVTEGELWTGGYSPKAMYGPWVGAALATVAGIVAVLMIQPDGIGWGIFAVAALVVWGALLLTLAYRRLSVKYRLTNQRLFHEAGILRRVTDRIELIDVDDVTVEQGIVERMLGVGTIRVTSSDRTSPELHMPGIDGVKEVADTIDSARRAERERRGLFIESV